MFRRRRAIRIATTFSLLAVIGFAVPVSASSQTLAPTLTITLNGTAFRSGQTMSVTAKLTPGTVAAPVDAYVIVQLPTGGYLSLQLGGGLVQGIVPIARGLVPFPYEGTLASYTFGGAEPLGTYKWYALLTRPGKFDETVSEQLIPFAVTTAGPESARATLSAALRSGDIAGAAAELAGVLIDVVGGLTPAARDTVARALDTCVVLESRSDYEVCATSDQRFRFVLVRDDLAKWRVAVW